MKPYKIGISGSYGGLNLGDEAILEVILEHLKKKWQADVVVFSRNPDDTQQRHKVRSVSLHKMHKDDACKELRELDLFILGGGGILFEGIADLFLRDVNWAKECNIPVMVFGISVGPISKVETKELVKNTLTKVDRITVRENEAKKTLNDLGVTQPIEVTADLALLLKPENFTREMLEKQGVKLYKERPVIGFSVREPGNAAPDLNVEQYHEVLANAADFMIERFQAEILFIPMERMENKDLQHSHAVIAKMMNAQSAHVLKGEFSSTQILGLMKHMEFVVGMRLHFLIFAAIHGVPFIPLPYASKVMGFLQTLEMPTPPLKEINSGKLCAFLDSVWDSRQSISEQLKKKIPALQDQARKNFQELSHLLESLPAVVGKKQ